ncbi:MAG: hypothetical protein ACYC35_26010, partial [Pirellulales bacterium]
MQVGQIPPPQLVGDDPGARPLSRIEPPTKKPRRTSVLGGAGLVLVIVTDVLADGLVDVLVDVAS